MPLLPICAPAEHFPKATSNLHNFNTSDFTKLNIRDDGVSSFYLVTQRWRTTANGAKCGDYIYMYIYLCVCVCVFSSRTFVRSFLRCRSTTGVILPHAQDCLGTVATRKDFDTNILYCNICMPIHNSKQYQPGFFTVS